MKANPSPASMIKGSSTTTAASSNSLNRASQTTHDSVAAGGASLLSLSAEAPLYGAGVNDARIASCLNETCCAVVKKLACKYKLTIKIDVSEVYFNVEPRDLEALSDNIYDDVEKEYKPDGMAPHYVIGENTIHIYSASCANGETGIYFRLIK